MSASWFYRLAIRARNARFDRGVGVATVDRPVISVGNLTTGGVGKTPMVIWLAELLTKHRHRPVIAMRGYGSGRGERSDEEAEYLDGKIYVWQGGNAGGAVNGSDSDLYVYDIYTDTWSVTPTLQDSGVVPGFRSGAFDIWGVAITADPVHNRLFVSGGEANKHIYVFDVASQTWTVAPIAIYDGGWGDGLEYVNASETLYQIDGRNALNTPQGTAQLVRSMGDINGDGSVGGKALLILLGNWGPCETGCCPADLDGNGSVGVKDLLVLLGNWG